MDYMGSGGPSRVLRLESGDQLTVELHPESFTFLWSTDLAFDEWLRRASQLVPAEAGTATLLR